jgi:hypothetical protein
LEPSRLAPIEPPHSRSRIQSNPAWNQGRDVSKSTSHNRLHQIRLIDHQCHIQQAETNQQINRPQGHHSRSIHNKQHTTHKQQIQRSRSQATAEQGIQSSRNPTTTLIATIPGKSTTLTFHDFCISSFTHYAVIDYARITRVESRIENYSSRNHRKKPSLIILSQSRPPQISVYNTSQATLQTQIPSRAKPQSCSRTQKTSCKYTKT